MCGILFTTINLELFDIEYVIKFLKKRGPDKTNIKKIDKYTFVHTLLSMTGPLTEQPFYSDDGKVICIFNGEIYNFEDFGKYKSDGECLVPLYEKYGDNFITKLDGEFSILLVDLSKNILIMSTDIFGTRPLWFGYDNNNFGISTYKSCLNRINLLNNFQILANKTYTFDLKTLKIIKENRVHTFDLNQHKTNFDDWNKSFSESIKKRTKYAKCGIFIGMSGGYDSGAIACELTKQNVEFTAYSIVNVEDKNVMNERNKIIKNPNSIELSRDEFLKAREYLKENSEEYILNIDNGEKDQYNEHILQNNYNKETAEKLLNVINFRKNGQVVTDDNGGIGCSYICSRAIQHNAKIYLSGSGADEIFSDYGFNGVKYFNHSTIGGYFPNDLKKVFPWKNFFGNTQRAYLMKEEYVAGSYGIEGRYPFLDKYVVQEFLWLIPEIKNSAYKSPLNNYLTQNNFPFEKNQKTGFGCGFAGPNIQNISYVELSETQKNDMKTRKVTDAINSQLVDFNKLSLKKTKSFESYYLIDKTSIKHNAGNCYTVNININDFGLKFYDKSRYVIQEDDIPLFNKTTSHDMIRNVGNGTYCFWTSNTLYLSSSDNSDPRHNEKTYSIIKLNNNSRQLKYENCNEYNSKKYFVCLKIKNCAFNSIEYFNIRKILTTFNYIPNLLICDNYNIFMDIPNVDFDCLNDFDKYINDCRVIVDNFNTINIDDIRDKLFNCSYYDNNYTIIKGNEPVVTITILSVSNNQFKYALESALSQNVNCYIKIIKNLEAVEANNTLVYGCNTKYAIQQDEDMIFFDNESANKMVKQIQSQDIQTWHYCYSLKDLNFGVGNEYQLLGMKIFNIELMKKHNMNYSNENSFALDRMIQIKAKELKLKSPYTMEQIGYHQKYNKPFDLFLRCAKIGLEFTIKLDNWGIYEVGMFLKYITQYEYKELTETIHFIIKKFGKDTNVFFNKLQQVSIPEYFTKNVRSKKGYHIDEHKFHYMDDLKNKKNISKIDDAFIPEKTTTFYCLVGFIYPFYFEFVFNLNKYPIDWFVKTFE